MVRCAACNHENSDGVNFCGKCGSPLEPALAGHLSREESKTLPFNQFPTQGQFNIQEADLEPAAIQVEGIGLPVSQINMQNRLQTIQRLPENNNKLLWGLAILGMVVVVGLGGWLLGYNLKSPARPNEQPLAAQLLDTSSDSKQIAASPQTQLNDNASSSQEKAVLVYNDSCYSWERITASSTLAPEGRLSYDPPLIVDGDENTAWVEGRSDAGINEWVRLESRQSRTVSRIEIKNGYAASEKLFYANNRPSRLKIEFSDGSMVLADIQDGYGSKNTVQLNQPVTTSFIKVTILDVYHGQKYDDTCIAEIWAY